MAGRGGVRVDANGIKSFDASEIPYPSDVLVQAFTSANVWQIAHDPLHDTVLDPGKTCGIGPGIPFARQLISLQEAPHPTIGLIPCAKGETRLDAWQGPGCPLFDRMVVRTLAAQAAAPTGSRVCGVLWYQGESDAVDQHAASTYKERFLQFVQALRVALNDTKLPVVQVAVTAARPLPYVSIVRDQQLSLGEDVHVPGVALHCKWDEGLNVATCDAGGLPLQPDGVHLTTEAQATMGEALARLFHFCFSTSS